MSVVYKKPYELRIVNNHEIRMGRCTSPEHTYDRNKTELYRGWYLVSGDEMLYYDSNPNGYYTPQYVCYYYHNIAGKHITAIHPNNMLTTVPRFTKRTREAELIENFVNKYHIAGTRQDMYNASNMYSPFGLYIFEEFTIPRIPENEKISKDINAYMESIRRYFETNRAVFEFTNIDDIVDAIMDKYDPVNHCFVNRKGGDNSYMRIRLVTFIPTGVMVQHETVYVPSCALTFHVGNMSNEIVNYVSESYRHANPAEFAPKTTNYVEVNIEDFAEREYFMAVGNQVVKVHSQRSENSNPRAYIRSVTKRVGGEETTNEYLCDNTQHMGEILGIYKNSAEAKYNASEIDVAKVETERIRIENERDRAIREVEELAEKKEQERLKREHELEVLRAKIELDREKMEHEKEKMRKDRKVKEQEFEELKEKYRHDREKHQYEMDAMRMKYQSDMRHTEQKGGLDIALKTLGIVAATVGLLGTGLTLFMKFGSSK